MSEILEQWERDEQPLLDAAVELRERMIGQFEANRRLGRVGKLVGRVLGRQYDLHDGERFDAKDTLYVGVSVNMSESPDPAEAEIYFCDLESPSHRPTAIVYKPGGRPDVQTWADYSNSSIHIRHFDLWNLHSTLCYEVGERQVYWPTTPGIYDDHRSWVETRFWDQIDFMDDSLENLIRLGRNKAYVAALEECADMSFVASYTDGKRDDYETMQSKGAPAKSLSIIQKALDQLA